MSTFVRKAVSIGIALATTAMLAGPAGAQSLSSSDVAAIMAQIQALQAQLAASQVSTPSTSYTFTRNLTVGAKGADVSALQSALISGGYLKISAPTGFFGNMTKTALAAWQSAKGISPAAGFFGPISRAAMSASGPVVVVPPNTIPTGTDLMVSVASDSPSSMIIGSGTAFNPALKVKFSAGSKDVKISALTVAKGGFVTNSNITGVDVVDEMGVRYGQVISSVNADNTIYITFGSTPLTVSAGMTKSLTVRFNLAIGASSGSVMFSLASVSAITADTTAISGSFPLAGSTMQIVSGSSALASSTINVLTSTGSSTLNVDLASAQEITKFRVSENSSNEDLKIYKWTFYNYGNATDKDYADVQLVAQDGTVLATAQPMGAWVTFDLASNPYTIGKGLTKDFTVKAKLIGGTTKTIKLVVYNNYDVDFRGATTGVSILPTAGSNDATFPIGNAYNMTTIGSGSITLTLASDSPSTAVVPGSQNVMLAKFNAKPTGENYELRQISFGLDQDASSIVLTGTVFVKVNGATVYSEGASAWGADGTVRTITLSSYPVLTAGQNNTITVEVSVNSTATASDSYFVNNMDLVQVKRLVSGDLLSDNDSGLATAAIDGLAIAVKAAKLAVTTLATPVANSVVGGSNNFEYATIQLNAQAGGEDVKVTTVIVTHTGTAPATTTDVSNLYMYKDSETSPLTTTASTATNGSTVTFSFSSPITITRATPVTLHLKADALTGSTSNHRFYVASSSGAIVATGVSTGNSLTHGTDITYAGGGQQMAHVAGGTLTLSLVSGSGASPSTNQVVAVGTANGTYFAFKMTSQYETQKITSLKITATSATALATTTLTNIRLYEGSASTPFAQASQFDSCGSNACVVTFTASDNLLSAAVPTTGVNVYVKADVAAGGTVILGDDFKFQITSSTADIATKGSVTAGTTATKTGTPTASGYTYVVPASVAISAVSPLSATDVGTGSGQTVGVFKITNSGSAPIYLGSSTMTFANGGSASTSLTFDMSASAMGGGQSDVSVDYPTSTTGTTGASSTVAFDLTAISAANRKIDGGSWRYVTIKTSGAAANNNTFQFSVSALGNVTFHVDEADLGYSGNSDSDISDTIVGLYVDGTPSLGSVTAKN